MNVRRIRRPSPALVVAVIALFVALGGTAGAVVTQAVPLAKRALTADNAKKLGGQTSAQIVSQASKAAQAPGPASTASGLVTIKTAPFAIPAGQQGDFSASCDAGQKAVGGGYDNPAGTAFSVDTRPSNNGASWSVYLLATDSSAAIGSVYAVCLK
jgi:hypothetical protein